MKATRQSMQGITFLGFVFTLIVIVFAAIIGMSLFPPYMEHFAVKQALEDLAPEVKGNLTNRAHVVDLLSRKFQVNNIKIPPQTLQIEKKDKVTWLILKYETRVHVMANVDAVVMFDERVPVEG